MTKNVQISINDDLMNKIDAYAKDNFMSRSAFFSMLATQHFQALEVTDSLKEVTLCIKKIASGQKVDDDTLQKLDDFERLSKLLNYKV
jgi:hypothetical protein